MVLSERGVPPVEPWEYPRVNFTSPASCTCLPRIRQRDEGDPVLLDYCIASGGPGVGAKIQHLRSQVKTALIAHKTPEEEDPGSTMNKTVSPEPTVYDLESDGIGPAGQLIGGFKYPAGAPNGGGSAPSPP